MASTPYEANTSYEREDEAPRERSVGEHVFIWVAWALAAAFWGATLTTISGILGSAGPASSAIAAAGAPGGWGYLALVVAAFLALAGALAYASLRSASGATRVSEVATASLYDSIERQQGEDRPFHSTGEARAD
jgi:hypothetical protein